jgi:hypothetical protein
MPAIKCNAIKKDGVTCGCIAKDNGRCGTHKAENIQAYKWSLSSRIFFIYSCLDINNRIPVLMKHPRGWSPATVEAGLEHIKTIQDIIRQDYTWIGEFTASHFNQINATAIMGDRRRAEMNIPAIIRHQANLMHEWYIHLHTVLTSVDRVTRIEMSIDQFYNTIFVTEILRPWIRDNWALLDHVQKRELYRGFHNMRILGQFTISNIVDVVPPAPIVAVNEFVNDKQNVHRKETVDYINKMFASLKKISVSNEQRTLGEVLYHCKMKPEAEVQMVKMYHSGDSIYEHQNAYKRSLDHVWSFIRRHENKKELYIRLADEMNDNIGMCAQGNLSRICNVLCGYSEEFKPPVAQGTLVQNIMGAIASDSKGDKINRAKIALKDLLVPETEWSVWLDAFEEE